MTQISKKIVIFFSLKIIEIVGFAFGLYVIYHLGLFVSNTVIQEPSKAPEALIALMGFLILLTAIIVAWFIIYFLKEYAFPAWFELNSNWADKILSYLTKNKKGK